MRTRGLILFSAFVLLASVGARCKQQPPVIVIVTPTNGQSVELCTFTVDVQVSGNADIATFEARLNGQPLALQGTLISSFPSTWSFTGSLDHTVPLAGANTLEAEVQGLTSAQGSALESVSFDYEAPEPRARVISSVSDLITGPHGNSKIGDYLLENCTARFIVQNAPQRDLTGIGQYGGNLIDAELRDNPGKDNFFEIQPILNIETVINADVVEIVNDGTNGSPAIVRSCGPDDLLDYINANTLVDDLLGPGSFPASANDNDLAMTGCTEYILAAGKSHVEMKTTVFNQSASPVDVFIGDYINGAGETEQWTSARANANPSGLTSGLGEMAATTNIGVFSLFGFGEAEGVDYGYVPLDLTGPTGVPTSPIFFPTSSFTQSGVTATLHSHSVILVLFVGFPANFRVPAAVGATPGSRSFRRFFGVGDGSASNAIDLRLEVTGAASATLSGCVTVGGQPAPGARVAVGRGAGAITELTTHFVTGADGCYSGKLPASAVGIDYLVAGERQGTPYDSGTTVPDLWGVNLKTGESKVQDIFLPATGRVEVTVRDQNNDPIPARIGVVGTDPSPEITYSFLLQGLIELNTALFHDISRDPIPQGLVWVAYTDASGSAAFDLEPGNYDVWVSRGTEYSAFSQNVTVSAAPAPPTVVNAQIAPVLDTTGFVSSDFHVHQIPSSDSRISFRDRVIQFAGEGVDNIIVTDHDRHTDLNPKIAAESLTPFVHATVGEEITTFDYGHFNAYPLGLDSDRITFGSTDWALAAAGPGLDFPSAGAFTGTPEQIYDAVFTTTKVAGGLLNTSPEVAVQINHFGSHFSPLKIDTSLTPPVSQLTDAEKAARRFCSSAVAGSCAAVGDLFFHFPALEIWNGYNRGHVLSEFLTQRIGTWANHLNQGLKTTAIYDTDSHEFFNTRSGGARSWTPSSSDSPALIDDDEVGNAVKTGRVVGGQGVYVQTRVFATNDPLNPATTADFTLGGNTQVTILDAQATLEIHVQAPLWAPYDTIEIYRNPTTRVVGCNGTSRVDFDADPTDCLELSGQDTCPAPIDIGTFTRSTVNVHPSVAGASRFETLVQVPYTLTEDSWLAVVVKGTDGVSASMFPVMPASLSQGGVPAVGATNALYVDIDGDADLDLEDFEPPGVTCTNCAGFCGP